MLRQLRSIYSLINLTGLIAGLSAFVLIFLWVMEELSYDRFHSNHHQVFRIVENQFNQNGEAYPLALTPGPLGNYLKNTFPEVDLQCRLFHVDFILRYEDQAYYHTGLAADPAFFDIFSFPLAQGESQSFHQGTDKVIISEKLAVSYFGNVNPLGKIIRMAGRDLMVTAVMKSLPANTHLQFDYVIPFDFLESGGFSDPTQWSRNSYHTYLTLKPSESIASFKTKITNVIKLYEPESTTEIDLQPLADIHLKSGHLNNDMAGHGNYQYVIIFSAVAIFLLIIASINYANLATARSLKRAKEAGVRKVIGASRFQLITHFFSESLLYCVMAFLLAILIAWVLLPSFNELTGKQLAFDILVPSVFIPLAGSVFFCAFLGGAYPALLLSSLNPAVVLKGFVKTGKSTILFRRVLVVVQFMLTISFLTGTLLIGEQLDYMQSRKLGFEKENILTFSANRNLRKQYPAFKHELQSVPVVQEVTASNSKLSFSDQSTSDVVWEGKDPGIELLFHQLMVDHDFVKTFAISISAGRDFSTLIASDSTAVLLNEEAVRQMGLTDAVNKSIQIGDRKGTIIGVVKDFNFKSAHKKIEPVVIYIDPLNFYEVSVRLRDGNLAGYVKAVETTFKKFNPDSPFEYSFLNEDIDALYRNEQRTRKIFSYFSALSIFISCLGLLGIVMFVIEQRAKEVALRKIMGATEMQLSWMLSFEFIVLVVIAFVLAAPVMYYISTRWLTNFAYRIEPGIWLFLSSGLISLAIAWITVGYKSYRASISNPIAPLRSE